MSKLIALRKSTEDERGSLALEQVLFIAAIVLVAAGLTAFYTNVGNYLSNVGFATPPTNVGG